MSVWRCRRHVAPNRSHGRPARHWQFQHDEVEVSGRDLVQGVVAVDGGGHRQSGAAQDSADKAREPRVVIDDEDAAYEDAAGPWRPGQLQLGDFALLRRANAPQGSK